jgi:uncharacterized membrane protein
MRAPISSSLFARVSRPFIAGVLGLLPLALTLAVLAWMVVFLHDTVGPASAFGTLLRSIGLSIVSCEVVAYSAGLVGTLAAVYGIGVLLQSGVTSRWQGALDDTLQQLPLVSSIYETSKHVRSLFDRKDEQMTAMTPVLCQFGGAGGTTALALLPSAERIRIGGRDYHAVLIPTAPVPFGGALLYVPVEWVQPARCGVREFASVYMSMGFSSAQHLSERSDVRAVADDRGAGGPDQRTR